MTPARAVVLALVFAHVAILLFWRVTSEPWRALDPPWVEGALKVVFWAGPAVLLAAWFAERPLREGTSALGLHGRAWAGYGFGFFATIPMAAALLFGGLPHFNIASVVGSVVLGPIGEEALFRGVLLTVLITVGRWPPWIAIVTSALAFGVSHVSYVPVSTGQLISAGWPLHDAIWFTIEDLKFFGLQISGFVLGGVLFGWVAYRWQSLWPAVGLHAFINLWWDASAGPFGIASVRRLSLDALPIAHAISVILAIALTIKYTTTKSTKRAPDAPSS